jgi:hypothetical protein
MNARARAGATAKCFGVRPDRDARTYTQSTSLRVASGLMRSSDAKADLTQIDGSDTTGKDERDKPRTVRTSPRPLPHRPASAAVRRWRPALASHSRRSVGVRPAQVGRGGHNEEPGSQPIAKNGLPLTAFSQRAPVPINRP